MIRFERQPLLMVVSAPSGAGKTTLCDRLIKDYSHITYSVSCTTRAPREGEIDGVSYIFLSPEEFDAKVQAGAFLEHATVHGNQYGTLKETVIEALHAGRDVLMDIDVQGAEQIRSVVRDPDADPIIRHGYVDIFIAPPSMQDLQLRLWGRGKDDESVMRRRLERAQSELQYWSAYQYVVVNDQLDESYRVLRSIFSAEQHRVTRCVEMPSSPCS